MRTTISPLSRQSQDTGTESCVADCAWWLLDFGVGACDNDVCDTDVCDDDDDDDDDDFPPSLDSLALTLERSRAVQGIWLPLWLRRPPAERPLRARWKAYGGGRASQVLHDIVRFDAPEGWGWGWGWG